MTFASSRARGSASASTAGRFPVSQALADYRVRETVEPESKARVARRAAGLIRPGDRVILDGGTTTLAVVRALPRDLDATVITHSPTVAAALIDHARVEVFLLGGRIDKHSAVACGAVAAEQAAGLRADLFLLGVTGVHPEHGLTTGDAEEAAMKRALAARAADTYVLASAEKLGAVSAYTVLTLDSVAAVVTDALAGDPIVGQIIGAGADVVLAEP